MRRIYAENLCGECTFPRICTRARICVFYGLRLITSPSAGGAWILCSFGTCRLWHVGLGGEHNMYEYPLESRLVGNECTVGYWPNQLQSITDVHAPVDWEMSQALRA
jgi:hypothetical protein